MTAGPPLALVALIIHIIIPVAVWILEYKQMNGRREGQRKGEREGWMEGGRDGGMEG